MLKGFLAIFLFFGIFHMGFSQDTTRIIVPAKIVNGDTVALVDINPVMIFPPVRLSTKRETIRYDRLVYNVKKVYPYAKLAGAKLKEYKNILETMTGEKERKVF
ncbi:MAG: DUF4294 domain-containing protein, partial [Bacteroidota bacterium]